MLESVATLVSTRPVKTLATRVAQRLLRDQATLTRALHNTADLNTRLELQASLNYTTEALRAVR